MKVIQMKFLEFLDDDENIEENFQNLNQLFEDTKIRDCHGKLKLFLHMLLKIANNHHRGPNFFNKIERIMQLFKNDIKKYFSNAEIFIIFKDNKRILLYLIEEKIMTVDKYFVDQVMNGKYIRECYLQYFSPEITPLMNEKWFCKYYLYETMIMKELPENFYEMRKKGENESYLCELIRTDSVKDFIIYINKNCISFNARIHRSIYETNSFLIQKKAGFRKGITIIEYASFFGSIQIINYLIKEEEINLTPSLWFNAIHSNNSELIHLLEDNQLRPSIKNCFIESIKCHHNDIANFFISNYFQNENDNSYDTFIKILKYYNFSFLQNECINESSFSDLCQYDYYSLVKFLLISHYVDINNKTIQNNIIQ